MTKSEIQKELENMHYEIDAIKSETRDTISRKFGITKDYANELIDEFLEGGNRKA